MAIGFSEIRCDECGRFTALANGASSAEIFDFVAMCPDHTRVRCASCTERLGPVESNARPANGDMSPYETIYDDGHDPRTPDYGVGFQPG